jgi:hypothetical protein
MTAGSGGPRAAGVSVTSDARAPRLELRLPAQTSAAPHGRVRRRVFKGRGGLVKGVNPLSNEALLEVLDGGA